LIFGDLTKKVERQVQELEGQPTNRKLKAIQVLLDISKEDPKPARSAIPAAVRVLGDDSSEVRVETLKLLKGLSKVKGYKKDILQALFESIPVFRGNLTEALDILRRLAPGSKELIDKNIPPLVDMLESHDEATRSGAAMFLEEFQIPANKYSSALVDAKLVLDDAERCGADIAKAKYMLNAARTGMKKAFYEEMEKAIDLAKQLANDGRKTVRLWRVSVPGARTVDIAPGARNIVACGSDKKLYYIDRNGNIVWSRVLPEVATCVALTVDESRILVGCADGFLHCFTSKGEELWKYRMSAQAVSIAVADSGNAIISGSDNNLYVIGPTGAMLAKHWTERPGWRVGVSGDGEIIVMSYRDHNVYSYDKNLFLRWKYMGGIWNDVVISRDGESMAAGSQGNDVMFFSKIGVVQWKTRTDDPVAQLAISFNGDCLYITDARYIYAFNRSGKLLYKYNARDPMLTMACDTSGEYLALVYSDRIILTRNREMVRQLVLGSTVLLDNIQRLGVDVLKPTELFAKARAAFAANDLEKGTEFASEAMRILDAEKGRRAEELTASIKVVVDEAKAVGADTSKSEGMLKAAHDSLRKGQLDRVLLLLGQAREEAEIARRVQEGMIMAEKEAKSGAARAAIRSAIAMTDEAVEFGMEATQAEAILQKAIHATDTEDYEKAMAFLRQLEEHVRAERERLPGRVGANFKAACEILDKSEISPEMIEKARSFLSGAIVFYDKTGDLRKLAETYERLGFLEEKRGKIPYSKFLYQKAVNTYFKVGEIDQVLTLLVERLRRLEAITDKKLHEYTIEEIFLIFRDGRLIIHNTRRLRPDVDNQLLGGMLVAIQNFVQEGFRNKEDEILNELRYGKTRVLVERGDFLYLALVITGQEPEEKREEMKRVLKEVEEKYRPILSTWDGDTSKLWGAKKMVDVILTGI